MENYSDFKKCCFSGYRPSKFPFKLKYGDVDFEIFQKRLFNTIKSLIDGFDIIAAEAVLYYRGKVPNIKLICAVPFENQEVTYSDDWKNRYDFVLQCCNEVVILSKNYHKGCYQNRNKFMVDNSDYIVTWYDGQKGGTRNTLSYAEKKKKYIINLNTSYLSEFNNKQMNIDI